MRFQQTIQKSISCKGVGLHSGVESTLTLMPAPPNTGVILVRRDQGVTIPAHVDEVVTSVFSSSVGRDDVEIRTVEHLLAALAGLHVDNLYVEVDGPEIPIMDGSASPFVRLLRQAGILQQEEIRTHLKIVEPLEVSEGDRYIRIEPSSYPEITYTLEFDHSLLPYQVFRHAYSPEGFSREIAPARTFGFLKDVERLQAGGFALGASLQNVVVLGGDRVLNQEGLRYSDEFIRHKVLDLIGDLFLLGVPFVGHVKACRSGHALNNRLVSTLLRERHCWTLVGEPTLVDSLHLSVS
ncbi:MAG: UDP-3-O-acyl-N-acetylglucosamine deacetylase [Nitrospirae bacterium]|nr:UDP-3-O-acyl-N-acetylglucosamine deacetylase [Nitrospirota bacterium]